MKSLKIIIVLILSITQSLKAQSLGVKLAAAATPNTTLDVNGSVAFREGTALTLVNGANNNVTLADYSFFRIIEPTAAFNISGLTNGQDGRLLYLVNATTYNMTINNASAASLAANRIQTGTSSDLIIVGGGTITLIYSATLTKWSIISTTGAIPFSLFIVKSADESVTNSTTLQDDDHLLFPVGANETWNFEAALFVDGNSGHIKYAIDVPSGTLKIDIRQWAGTGVGNTPHEIVTVDNTATTTSFDINNTGTSSAYINGLVTSGGTGGSVIIRWAQRSSNGTPTYVRQNSYLKATRLN